VAQKQSLEPVAVCSLKPTEWNLHRTQHTMAQEDPAAEEAEESKIFPFYIK
jgi:hypothetical protein